MAKHATRRSYKKRASKKRRTIRKLKRTMRRKIQRGGVGEDVIIKLMLQLAPQVIPVILSLINLGNVELLMSIIKLLSGNPVSIGLGRAGGFGGGSKSNKRQLQLQRGGGLKEIVLGKLDELAIKFQDKPNVVACIGKIKDRINEEPEPAAAAPAAVGSSTELDSLTTELTTDKEITQADKDIVTTQDPELTTALKEAPVAENTPVDTPLPPAVAEAAKMSIINKMITLFNERIKSKITAKLDGMISNLQGKVDGKVDKEVINCIGTLKTAIVEDIVTQIKNNVSEISSRILDKIFKVLGELASEIITFLAWSAVQIAYKNYSAIPIEGGKLLFERSSQLVGAVAETGRKVAGLVSSRMNRMRENTIPVQVPAEQQKPGLLGRIGSGFIFGR